MPCPYFEPRTVRKVARFEGVRLPLIDEYEGLCHAGGKGTCEPEASQLAQCNHGYARGMCARFPQNLASSAMRYSVTSRTAEEITLIWVEEQDHTPARWGTLRYSLAEDRAIGPEETSTRVLTQALAFCRSFLMRLQAAGQEETNAS